MATIEAPLAEAHVKVPELFDQLFGYYPSLMGKLRYFRDNFGEDCNFFKKGTKALLAEAAYDGVVVQGDPHTGKRWIAKIEK